MMRIYVFFMLTVSAVYGIQQQLNKNNEITLHIGANPGLAINFNVLLDTTIRLEINQNVKITSNTVSTLEQGISYDYVRLPNVFYVYTTISKSQTDNVVSLAWLSAYGGCDVTLFKNTLFFGPIPTQLRQKNVQKELTLNSELSSKHCFINETVYTPQGTQIYGNVICFAPELNNSYIKIPKLSKKLDRTAQQCYVFSNILRLNTCSTDMKGDTYTLQEHNQSFFLIGLNALINPVVITQTYGQQFVSPGWNEKLNYDFIIIVNILLTLVIFSAWSLYFKRERVIEDTCLEQPAYVLKTDPPEKVFFESSTLNLSVLPILCISVLFLCYVVLYETLVRDLFFRLQYISIDDNTENTQVYIIIATLAFLLNVNIVFYSFYCRDPRLNEFSFESLLATTLAVLFVGRKGTAEENVTVFIVALLWIFSQIYLLQKNTGKAKHVQGLLFLISLPFAILFFVEPFMRNIPVLGNTSFVSCMVLIMVPITLNFGYKEAR